MIKLTGSKVAVVPIENPDRIGHIYIPEMAKDRLNQGFVKYRGDLCRHVKIGDYVVFSGYTGTLFHMEGEGKLIILPEKFIVATVPELKYQEIPGLYFRDIPAHYQNQLHIMEVLYRVLPDLTENQYMELAMRLDKEGLTHTNAIPFYTANYELAMEYIARAYGDDPAWRDSIRVVNKNPFYEMEQDERNELVSVDEDEEEYDELASDT